MLAEFAGDGGTPCVQASCGPVDATDGCCATSSSRVSIQSLESEWSRAGLLSSDVRGDDAVHRVRIIQWKMLVTR